MPSNIGIFDIINAAWDKQYNQIALFLDHIINETHKSFESYFIICGKKVSMHYQIHTNHCFLNTYNNL